MGYALAMRVLQSDLYQKLDDEERAECDAFIRRGPDEWTTEKPTNPGWYWFDCPMIGPKPRIGFATKYFFSCDGFNTPMCDLLGLWLGPVPEPKRP